MENLTPLQQRAHELREGYKRAEAEKQKKLQDKLDVERRELMNKFSSSFSTLYGLLIGSNVQVEAEVNSVNPVILLSCNGNKATIGFERTSGTNVSWSLFDKSFKSTQPSRVLGVAAIREDEDKLIIAIEEILFKPQPAIKEEVRQTLSFPYPSSR